MVLVYDIASRASFAAAPAWLARVQAARPERPIRGATLHSPCSLSGGRRAGRREGGPGPAPRSDGGRGPAPCRTGRHAILRVLCRACPLRSRTKSPPPQRDHVGVEAPFQQLAAMHAQAYASAAAAVSALL